jgi:F-type H+-transporting ATPase subunit delta
MQGAPRETERYADSLLALCEAAGATDRVYEELPELVDFLGRREALRRFLADPGLRVEGKKNALESLLGRELHPLLLHFLLILQSQGRVGMLPRIAEAFFRKVGEREAFAYGELLTAMPLREEKIRLIEGITGRMLGKTVRLTVREDRRLIGGVRVRVGDVVLDGTVERQLAAARQALLSGAPAEVRSGVK